MFVTLLTNINVWSQKKSIRFHKHSGAVGATCDFNYVQHPWWVLHNSAFLLYSLRSVLAPGQRKQTRSMVSLKSKCIFIPKLSQMSFRFLFFSALLLVHARPQHHRKTQFTYVNEFMHKANSLLNDTMRFTTTQLAVSELQKITVSAWCFGHHSPYFAYFGSTHRNAGENGGGCAVDVQASRQDRNVLWNRVFGDPNTIGVV